MGEDLGTESAFFILQIVNETLSYSNEMLT